MANWTLNEWNLGLDDQTALEQLKATEVFYIAFRGHQHITFSLQVTPQVGLVTRYDVVFEVGKNGVMTAPRISVYYADYSQLKLTNAQKSAEIIKAQIILGLLSSKFHGGVFSAEAIDQLKKAWKDIQVLDVEDD